LRITGAFRTILGTTLNIVLGISPLHLVAIEAASVYLYRKKNMIRTAEILKCSGLERRNKKKKWDLAV